MAHGTFVGVLLTQIACLFSLLAHYSLETLGKALTEDLPRRTNKRLTTQLTKHPVLTQLLQFCSAGPILLQTLQRRSVELQKWS